MSPLGVRRNSMGHEISPPVPPPRSSYNEISPTRASVTSPRPPPLPAGRNSIGSSISPPGPTSLLPALPRLHKFISLVLAPLPLRAALV
jgi:hypothetical protein